MTPTAVFDMRLPNSPLMTKPAAGNKGMSQMRSRKFMRLPLHQIDFVDVHRFLVLEHGDDDAEADCGFGGSDGNHKDGEDLSCELPKPAGKRDEVDVDGVHHEL